MTKTRDPTYSQMDRQIDVQRDTKTTEKIGVEHRQDTRNK